MVRDGVEREEHAVDNSAGKEEGELGRSVWHIEEEIR
jgi:hypothetical protein